MVTRDPRDKEPAADLAKRHPTLVVEVLSDCTAAYDYGRKFELYRSLESLREYVLIAQDRRHVDLFRKDAEGRWVLYAHGGETAIHFESISMSLAVETLYEDVPADSTPPD